MHGRDIIRTMVLAQAGTGDRREPSKRFDGM
jgi:hypothetical protein